MRKWPPRFAPCYARLILTVLLEFISISFALALSAPAAKAQGQPSSPALKLELQPLSFFIGHWSCTGEFSTSKKPISSRIAVSPDLGGSWLAFRWDDNPPNQFHALELWGFDKSASHFKNFLHDNFSGARLFNSPGWTGDTFTWTGDLLANPPAQNQRFVITRKSPQKFAISWEVLKGQSWLVGDRLTCRRAVAS